MSLLVHWFKALQMSNMGAEGCAKLWAAEHQKQPPGPQNEEFGEIEREEKMPYRSWSKIYYTLTIAVLY